MALIKCKECGKEISNKANSCPHCGFVYKKAHSTIKTIIVCLLTIIILALLILFISWVPGYISKQKGIKAIDNIVGEYKLISNNELSLDETIKLTKENTIDVCNCGYFPINFSETPFGLYINGENKYIVTELRNITHNEFDNETIFLQYDDNKLSLDSSIHSIKCKHGTSEENPLTKNIEIEYQRLK